VPRDDGRHRVRALSRIVDRLEQLYAIGAGPGANRPHGSQAEDEAHELAEGWMRKAELEVEIDPDGNLIGRHPTGSEIWTGSHLDTVPRGGKFDGALGVVAGIEAVERAGRGSVAVFRGEEVGCVGSRALVARGGSLPRAFVELHIEQGPVLEEAGAPLGIVTGIVGYTRGELVFEGRAAHAGTTPMHTRDDALLKAGQEIVRIAEVARGIPGAVATVGRIQAEPGAVNVVPERVRLSVDARAPDRRRLDLLISEIGFEPTQVVEPLELSEICRKALGEQIQARNLPIVELVSGAGHDAGVLAAAGVESGMLFVRSLNEGVSHSPDELSSEEDVALAVEVLGAALLRLGS
jgi:acetylornithine deacetylase/succinyl-diaminopimelate desuccinylase-like protein